MKEDPRGGARLEAIFLILGGTRGGEGDGEGALMFKGRIR